MYVWFSLISPYTPRRDIPLAVVAMMVALLTFPACTPEEHPLTASGTVSLDSSTGRSHHMKSNPMKNLINPFPPLSPQISNTAQVP